MPHDLMYPCIIHLQDLPMYAFERLLQSDALQVQCENEAYFLVHVWLSQSEKAKLYGVPLAFNRLYRHIRYQPLTPDYVSHFISCCPFMMNSRYLRQLLAQLSLQQNTPQWLKAAHQKVFPQSSSVVPQTSIDRSQGQPREWKVRVEIKLRDLLDLEQGKTKYFPSGPALGYPVILSISHRRKDCVACIGTYKCLKCLYIVAMMMMDVD